MHVYKFCIYGTIFFISVTMFQLNCKCKNMEFVYEILLYIEILYCIMLNSDIDNNNNIFSECDY